MIKVMHRLLLAASLLSLLPSAGRAQSGGNITAFYPTVDSICSYPSLDRELTIVCQKKVMQRYVSFIGYKDTKHVFIAAVTLKPLSNPNTEISRVVAFDGIKPTLGKVETWGYVFDRNGDGMIDYIALVEGAAAFEDRDFPDDYPVRGEHLTKPQLEVFVGHCRLIFNHWADDNFDGTIDAGILCDMDPMRDWISRRIVARCSKFDSLYDEVWAFRTSIAAEHDTVAHAPTSVPYHALGKFSAELSSATMKEKTGILQLLNRAAKECGILKPSD